jgi:5-(aminomethyl)-3-furanmethanol phosphate kinase
MSALVAKIGGSLWRSPLLARWIAALSAYPGPVAIVPGGGPFADAVRAAQGPMRFSERAAHEMALLAMEQYGLALAGAFAGLELAATHKDANALHARGKIAVWRPSAMTLAADVPASWDLTSDSLSAFYARASGAARLLLIKSVDVGASHSPHSLVDPCFSAYATGLEVFIAGPRALGHAAEIFARGGVAGARVDFTPSQRKIA